LLAAVPLHFPGTMEAAQGFPALGNNLQADYYQFGEQGETELGHMPREIAGDHNRLSARSGLQVVRFHVWQDLTGVEGDVAPLHATVTLEMTSEWYSKLSKPDGSIKIDGVNGMGIVQARLLMYQAHYGLGLLQPGTRQMQFVMSPTPMYIRLNSCQTVRGTARMKFGDEHVVITLPETKVIFTR
jgi:hypothetical protein